MIKRQLIEINNRTTIYWEKQKLIVLILKYIEEPYKLSLDVWKAFLGSEARVSSTLISLALFLQEHKEVCDLSSQKLSRKKSKSQQHFNSITHKAWTPIVNLQKLTIWGYPMPPFIEQMRRLGFQLWMDRILLQRDRLLTSRD